jgi:hypothetical protein
MDQSSQGSLDDRAAGRDPRQLSTAQALEAEALAVTSAGNQVGVVLRLIGPLAVRYHCPQLTQEIRSSRVCGDIDFAGYAKQSDQISALFASLGYEGDIELNVLHPDAGRLIFSHPETQTHADVFLDELNFCHPFQRERCRRGRLTQADVALERATFCHPIPWARRLEVDDPTIPLAELLLETLTVADLDEQDIAEAIALLGEHELAQDDAGHINGAQMAELCAQQWGLWHACSAALEKVGTSLPRSDLGDEARAAVTTRVATLLHLLEDHPKGAAWHEQAEIAGRTD